MRSNMSIQCEKDAAVQDKRKLLELIRTISITSIIPEEIRARINEVLKNETYW